MKEKMKVCEHKNTEALKHPDPLQGKNEVCLDCRGYVFKCSGCKQTVLSAAIEQHSHTHWSKDGLKSFTYSGVCTESEDK